MGEKAVVTVKGQVVIPVRFRRKLGIKKGTQLDIDEERGRLILQPVTREFIQSVAGTLKEGPSLTRALFEMRAEDKKMEGERIEKRRSG